MKYETQHNTQNAQYTQYTQNMSTSFCKTRNIRNMRKEVYFDSGLLEKCQTANAHRFYEVSNVHLQNGCVLRHSMCLQH